MSCSNCRSRTPRSLHGAASPLGVAVRRTLLCLTAALLIPSYAWAQAADAARWIEDLQVLARELPRRHVAPATERPVDAFQADVERLRSRIPSMSREAIILEFARLAASFGDSHTELQLAHERAGFHRFPVGMYFFGNELRVVVVARGYEDLLAMRLVAIGEYPIALVLDRIKPLIGDDFGNPNEILHSGPSFVMIPEVLVGLGLAPPGQPIAYVFETEDGQRVTKSFSGVPLREAAQSMTVRLLNPDREPHFMRNRDRWYVLERVEASDVLYVRISRSQNQRGSEPLAAFARRVTAATADAAVRRVVIDLRQNTGGNFNTTEPLASALCRQAKAGEVSRVYVILGRHTYSAAIVLAAQLKHGCEAVFVGEVPRAVPNRQADVGRFSLPNSRLEVTYSSRLRQPFPELGNTTEIPLDLVAPPTWANYRAGRDPALEAILASGREMR